MNKIIFLISFICSFNTMADGRFTPDPVALSFSRAAAKRLTLANIREILLHPTMKNCMNRLVNEAKKHDRGRRGLESAAWVIEHNENFYSCHFWPDSLRVRNGYDWDGFIPRQTVFSIHTHPKTSGGPRPSAADFDFNKSLGMIGLILSYQQKVISANYPGSKKYPRVIKSGEFRKVFNR